MYEFASSSATLLTVYTAVMHTRRMNVIPEADLGTMISVFAGAFQKLQFLPGCKCSYVRPAFLFGISNAEMAFLACSFIVYVLHGFQCGIG